ncbi:hypothetical protein F9B16_24395 [Actinomadura montaniterrae]|uniref:Uncharacterized protein n=1 Tax=Actinomadura montaniterrae TaxID=1803903 RepID=A0A6L3VUK4_9ACTN|nr:hypothetical protein F9B16_24395 [Actinomadura montaniterrae]
MAADFPDWAIWPSDAGHWYATRRADLPKELRGGGVWVTVDAGDLAGLRAELETQAERLQARRSEVLAEGGGDR